MTVLVCQKAPDFTAPAVLADGKIEEAFSLSSAIKGKYGLLFFYPLDFTFVCPSELIALKNRMDRFKELGVEVIAISIDSHFTHNAWRNTPINQGGVGALNYTMVGDFSHAICQAYGVEHIKAKVALRAAFLIDKEGVIRVQVVNDLPIGRNIDELLRLFEALQHHQTHGEVCPAGWQQGNKGMTASAEGVKEYLSEHGEAL